MKKSKIMREHNSCYESVVYVLLHSMKIKRENLFVW